MRSDPAHGAQQQPWFVKLYRWGKFFSSGYSNEAVIDLKSDCFCVELNTDELGFSRRYHPMNHFERSESKAI